MTTFTERFFNTNIWADEPDPTGPKELRDVPIILDAGQRPVLKEIDVTVPSGEAVDRQISVDIPDRIPPGNYTVEVGQGSKYGNAVVNVEKEDTAVSSDPPTGPELPTSEPEPDPPGQLTPPVEEPPDDGPRMYEPDGGDDNAGMERQEMALLGLIAVAGYVLLGG